MEPSFMIFGLVGLKKLRRSTSLTGTLSDQIQTGYESIYVTFKHTFCMTDILTDFGLIQNTIFMLCYVFIQAYFDVLFSSIRIMIPVHFTKILCFRRKLQNKKRVLFYCY